VISRVVPTREGSSQVAFGARKRGSWHVGHGARDPDQTYWTRGSPAYAGFWRRHTRIRIAAKVLALCLVPFVAFLAGSLAGWLNNTLGSLQSNDRPTVVAIKHQLAAPRPGVPVTILVLGSDRRQPRGPGNVDSILLARLDPASHRMALLFIPRDLRARVPGHGRQAITAAYRLGGPLLTLETIKGLTGLPINHSLDVDFQAFIDIVNALGGVHSLVPPGLGTPSGPSWASAPLQPGYRLLDGRQLLSYVRLEEDAYGGEGWLASQGTILSELRRQLATQVDWSHPLGALRVLKQATRNTLSDIAGLRGWYDTAKLLTGSEHGRVSQVHLTGRTVRSGGVTTVVAGPAQIGRAVQAFVSSATGS
jgi:LCP family protein required for cell wall assembly